MIRWVLKYSDAVKDTVKDIPNLQDYRLGLHDINVLLDVRLLLRPLADATSIIQGDKYPTLSWVLEIKQVLLQHLESCDVDTDIASEFSKTLSKNLSNWFGSLPSIIYTAALLTPQLRDSLMLNEKERNQNWSRLYAEFAQVPLPEPTPVHPPPVISSRPDRLYEEDDTTSFSSLRNKFSKRDTEDDEFRRYRALKPNDLDALTWWKLNEAAFPRLAVVARKVLGVVASDGPVERLFSTVGNTYTKKRQRMKGATTKMQVLMHENEE